MAFNVNIVETSILTTLKTILLISLILLAGVIMTAKFAHSDWLELLINQGLLGFIIYINYWKHYYISWRIAKNIEVKNILGLLLLIFLFKSIFSMSYASYTYYTNCLLGYCLANLYYNKKECV